MQVIPQILMKMLASLMTERFIKWAIVYALEIVVSRTETEEDDKLLARARKEWGV